MPLLAAAGAALCVDLIQAHRDTYVGAVSEGLFCGRSERFNCADVAAHPSSWLLGLPVAAWGLVFYATLLGLGLAVLVHRGADRKTAAAAGLALAGLALGFDAYLAFQMVFVIGSICPLCVASYAVNLLLFLSLLAVARTVPGPVSWFRLLPAGSILTRGEGEPYYREVFKLGTLFGVVAMVGLALAWTIVPLQEIRRFGDQQIDELLERIRSRPPEVDVAALGDQPARGSATPSVDLVFVADFRCSLCRALAQEADHLLEEFPDDLRIRFLNSPLDRSCNPSLSLDVHPGACWLAEAGECAHEQGRFWAYHSLLYQELRLASVREPAVREHLSKLGLDEELWRGCLDSGRGLDAVRRDVALVDSLKITVTPSTIVNGHVKPGSLFPWMLRKLVVTLRADARRGKGERP